MISALASAFLLAAPSLAAPAIGPQLATAKASTPAARQEEDDDDDRHAPVTEVTVTARRLDQARTHIEPALGASVYTLSNDAIEARPGGETGDLRSVLIQAPGVAIDASGALTVRGVAAPVQYRLNNIILPEGAGELGEALSARLAARTDLITGALPAQYGLTSGAVVNVTTKNGHYLAGGQAELYGGSGGTLEPAAEWSHVAGRSSMFLSGSLRAARHSARPVSRTRVAHDSNRELEGFGFVDHVVDATSRLSLIAGSVNERQQIPSIPSPPGGSATAPGTLTTHNNYLIAAYQRSDGPTSFQASLTGLLGRAQLRPDLSAGATAHDNSYQRADLRNAVTAQFEGASVVSAFHTVRAGITIDHQHLSRQEGRQQALAVRPTTRTVWSGFVQDEWLVAPGLVANVGVRGDRMSDVSPNFAAQPRAGLV